MEGMSDIAMRLWLFFGIVAIAAIGVIALAVCLCRRFFRIPYLILLPALFLALMVFAAAFDTDSEHLIFAVPFLASLPVSILLPILDPHHDIITSHFTIVGLWIIGPAWYATLGWLWDRYLHRKQSIQDHHANTPERSV